MAGPPRDPDPRAGLPVPGTVPGLPSMAHHLGYGPEHATERLRADVTKTGVLRRMVSVPRFVETNEFTIEYRPVHWHELPRFVRRRAQDKDIDVGEPRSVIFELVFMEF